MKNRFNCMARLGFGFSVHDAIFDMGYALYEVYADVSIGYKFNLKKK